MPTDKRYIMVPQDRPLCPTHVDNKNNTGFRKVFFSDCVTRSELSGVPLTFGENIYVVKMHTKGLNV